MLSPTGQSVGVHRALEPAPASGARGNTPGLQDSAQDLSRSPVLSEQVIRRAEEGTDDP